MLCSDHSLVTGILSNLRTGAFDVPPQEILTRDSVTISVDAVVYYQVHRVDEMHSYALSLSRFRTL